MPEINLLAWRDQQKAMAGRYFLYSLWLAPLITAITLIPFRWYAIKAIKKQEQVNRYWHHQVTLENQKVKAIDALSHKA